ncbi:dihydrodipicolinate synthase family protein [Porticoccaceae bacterium]|nr:dihydrodipicolinate synthase family protein [Porticoccaceae bacterium]
MSLDLNRRSFIQNTALQTAGVALAAQSTGLLAMSGRSSNRLKHVNQIPLRGVIPAALTPFDSNMNISLKDFQQHIKGLSNTEGVTAILVNGGAGEISTLSRDERRQVVAEAVSIAGDKTPIIVGLDELDNATLQEMAKDAELEGARGVMPMPPRDLAGAEWDSAYARHSEVFNATNLPVVIFQTIYSNEILTKLAEYPQVFAIKEASRTPFDFEKNIRSIRALDKNVAVWSTHTQWFLSDLGLGADGILSGMGSFAAELHVALVSAMHSGDLHSAKKISEKLFPLSQAIRHSCIDNDNFVYAVMKYALVRLGILKNAYVRPPNEPFIDRELQQQFDMALSKSGLLL